MSKLYDKHLFFVSKNLNWEAMTEEKKFKKVAEYVMGVQHPTNKRQDMARILHGLKLRDGVEPNHAELLELAIGITIN